MAITDEQFAKLPQYAKLEISRLREQNERLKLRNEWLEDENRLKVESSNTIISDGVNSGTAIPDYSEIEFVLDDPDRKNWRSRISVRLSRDRKSINIHGDDAIVVWPDVSNGIRVFLRNVRD